MYLVSKAETFAKLFFLISFTGFIAYVILSFYTLHTAYTSLSRLDTVQSKVQDYSDQIMNLEGDSSAQKLKFILLWSNQSLYKEGQNAFIANNCSVTNCFLTADKELLVEGYKDFDAIVFDDKVLKQWPKHDLPQERSLKQKYIFYSRSSSDERPICNPDADSFFNWTWTYKLYSDIFSPYIEVADLDGNVVAPSVAVKWPPVKANFFQSRIEELLGSKSRACAWIINKCTTRHDRMLYVNLLQMEMKRLNLDIDIFGCDHLKCPKGGCIESLKKDYYFYLVFEDSITGDYITSEVLKAYDNGAVPIVISGADISKFLPRGSYIDGSTLTPDRVAAVIEYSLKNKHVLHNYHYWRNRFRIRPTDQFQGVCQLCENLNNPKLTSIRSSYNNFRNWWYSGPLEKRCYPAGAENSSYLLGYLDESIVNKI